MLADARKQYPNQPYRTTTDFGEVVMVPSEWMEDIRNIPSLSFSGTVAQVCRFISWTHSMSPPMTS